MMFFEKIMCLLGVIIAEIDNLKMDTYILSETCHSYIFILRNMNNKLTSKELQDMHKLLNEFNKILF